MCHRQTGLGILENQRPPCKTIAASFSKFDCLNKSRVLYSVLGCKLLIEFQRILSLTRFGFRQKVEAISGFRGAAPRWMCWRTATCCWANRPRCRRVAIPSRCSGRGTQCFVCIKKDRNLGRILIKTNRIHCNRSVGRSRSREDNR